MLAFYCIDYIQNTLIVSSFFHLFCMVIFILYEYEGIFIIISRIDLAQEGTWDQ